MRRPDGVSQEEHHRKQVRLQRDPETHQRHGKHHRPQQVNELSYKTSSHISSKYFIWSVLYHLFLALNKGIQLLQLLPNNNSRMSYTNQVPLTT